MNFPGRKNERRRSAIVGYNQAIKRHQKYLSLKEKNSETQELIQSKISALENMIFNTEKKL